MGIKKQTVSIPGARDLHTVGHSGFQLGNNGFHALFKLFIGRIVEDQQRIGLVFQL